MIALCKITFCCYHLMWLNCYWQLIHRSCSIWNNQQRHIRWCNLFMIGIRHKKIDKSCYNACRTANPRRPQLYGLPKIHKPGNPIRPIVSFNCTPLSSLHKQLSIILKPLTTSPLRLNDNRHKKCPRVGTFMHHFWYFISCNLFHFTKFNLNNCTKKNQLS